jgi:hypothetical protein
LTAHARLRIVPIVTPKALSSSLFRTSGTPQPVLPTAKTMPAARLARKHLLALQQGRQRQTDVARGLPLISLQP